MSIFKYHHIKTQKQVFYNFNVLFKQKVNENLYKSTVTSLMNNESFTSNHTRNNLNGNNNDSGTGFKLSITGPGGHVGFVSTGSLND